MGVEHQFFVSVISDLGALGFILWMTHRLTTQTIPRLARQFEQAAEKQRADFKELLREQREMFEARARREEELYSQSIERLAAAIEKMPAPISLKSTRGGEG